MDLNSPRFSSFFEKSLAKDAKDARTRGTRRMRGMRFSSFFEKKLGKKLSENYIYWRLAELRGQTWGKMDFWLGCDQSLWTDMGLGGFS